MLTRIAVVISLLTMGGAGMCADAKLSVQQIGGQAELGTVEIHGVGAGEFKAEIWKTGKLNFVPDVRLPLIQPSNRGVYRNIYAPSVVPVENGWRVFYGAWDGIDTGNDCIYSVFTNDFLDFSDRHMVVNNGSFIHVCNVNAIRLPDGEYKIMCTAYPDKDGLNKPALFTSKDGLSWNGAKAPYTAKADDLIVINGYDKFKQADINGMNVILYEDGVYRLYFNNFKDFGKVFRATSKDCRDFTFDGASLDIRACVNDVKKLTSGSDIYYLMGLHMNGDTLWYSLSKDGMKFDAAKELCKNLGEKDRYMVAHGWVIRDNRVLGFLYGAGEVSGLNRNRIWARWLQKKVVFIAADGTRYEASGALGPDRQIISIPRDQEISGHFEIYGEDGSTVLVNECPGKLMSGAVYQIK